jgi:hypothetical protein
MLSIDSSWTDPAADQVHVAYTREFYAAALRHSTGQTYFNFPGLLEERDAAVRASYGANHARLARTKAVHDPDNRFHPAARTDQRAYQFRCRHGEPPPAANAGLGGDHPSIETTRGHLRQARRSSSTHSLASEEVRSAMEWAQVRALAADGVSQREIAAPLGINRRTVARLAAAAEPPRYSRSPAGSMLDPLEPVLRRLLDEWPEIKAPRVTEILRDDYGYAGSVDLVKRRLAKLRPAPARAAQRPAIGRGRCCTSIGLRCRHSPGSRAASGASMRWSALCRSPALRRRTSALTCRSNRSWRATFAR